MIFNIKSIQIQIIDSERFVFINSLPITIIRFFSSKVLFQVISSISILNHRRNLKSGPIFIFFENHAPLQNHGDLANSCQNLSFAWIWNDKIKFRNYSVSLYDYYSIKFTIRNINRFHKDKWLLNPRSGPRLCFILWISCEKNYWLTSFLVCSNEFCTIASMVPCSNVHCSLFTVDCKSHSVWYIAF